MAVQEIFNSTAVRSVEEQILDLYHETERKHWCNDENKTVCLFLMNRTSNYWQSSTKR